MHGCPSWNERIANPIGVFVLVYSHSFHMLYTSVYVVLQKKSCYIKLHANKHGVWFDYLVFIQYIKIRMTGYKAINDKTNLISIISLFFIDRSFNGLWIMLLMDMHHEPYSTSCTYGPFKKSVIHQFPLTT